MREEEQRDTLSGPGCALEDHSSSLELENAFLNLAHGLSLAKQVDQNATEQVLANWRFEAGRILGNHVGKVVEATAPGSPLHRREAKQQAEQAVREAIRQIEQQRTKASRKNSTRSA